MSEHVRQLISKEQIHNKVSELARRIENEHPNGVHLVGILNGCFIFLADLAREIKKVPVTVDFVGKSSYQGLQSSGAVSTTFVLKLPVSGKNVILVEDIIDTGLTLVSTIEEMRVREPASLKIAALVSKPARHKVEVNIDYLGFEIEDKFAVGYGLDANEKYRNLDFIGCIEKE